MLMYHAETERDRESVRDRQRQRECYLAFRVENNNNRVFISFLFAKNTNVHFSVILFQSHSLAQYPYKCLFNYGQF